MELPGLEQRFDNSINHSVELCYRVTPVARPPRQTDYEPKKAAEPIDRPVGNKAEPPIPHGTMEGRIKRPERRNQCFISSVFLEARRPPIAFVIEALPGEFGQLPSVKVIDHRPCG